MKLPVVHIEVSMRSTLTICALTSMMMVGCAVDPNDPEGASSTYASALTVTDTSAVLALVNYPGTTEAALNDAAQLDSRAAHNIVVYRVGADGIEPSADDIVFQSIAELDAIPYVGDSAFQKLQAYGVAHPPPASEYVEGVQFAGWESEAVVWGVNHAELTVLDGLLDSRASAALVAARPLASVTAMGPLAYVGTSALTHLRGQAAAWWNQMHSPNGTPALAGTFDGVAFDETTAQIALAIANEATSVQLSQHGISGTQASMITTHRPHSTLAQVSALSGIGSVTMTSLRTWAASGTWGVVVEPGSCVPTIEASITPSLPGLFFMSESDRPIDFLSFPGAGTTAPTASSVRALVGGISTETRSVDDFFVALAPTADENAAAVVEAAMRSQLTDLIYVKVHGSDRVVVNVYLVGRTACGDLVALHSVAIET